MPKQDFFTIPQYAKQLGISRIAVYKQVRAGKIYAVKIGRNYAIPVSSLEGKKISLNPQDFLSIPETAKQLGISRIALYKKAKKGGIDTKQVGRNYAVPLDSLKNIGKGKKLTIQEIKEKIKTKKDIQKESLKDIGKGKKLTIQEIKEKNKMKKDIQKLIKFYSSILKDIDALDE